MCVRTYRERERGFGIDMPGTEREKGKGVLATFGIEERDFFFFFFFGLCSSLFYVFLGFGSPE